MSGLATAAVAAAVIGGAVAVHTSNQAKSAANAVTAASAANAQTELDFEKAQYADQKPVQDALGLQSVATAKQDAAIAAQQATQSQSQFDKYQGEYAPIETQVGLDALGAQYMTPAQTAQLQAAQAALTSGTPAQQAAAQATITQLRQSASQAYIDNQNTNAARVTSTAAAQGAAATGAYTTAAGQTTAQGEQTAQSALGDGANIAGQYEGLADARRADQTGFYNDQASQLQAVAKQRAADYEAKAGTAANASIATAAGDRDRELALLGGDPNKMAAMAADIGNQEQLARIGSGNQVAATNIANLNAADDQARVLQQTGFTNGTNQQYGAQNSAVATTSSALDAARAARAAAGTTATQLGLQGAIAGQGIASAGQNAGVAITDAAKEKADANFTNLATGAVNTGRGLTNTSGAEATGAVTAGTAGVNNLNTADQSYNNATNAATGAFAGANAALATSSAASQNAIAAGNSVANSAGQVAGAVINGVKNLPSLFSSAPPVVTGSDTSGYNGTMNNPSAYVADQTVSSKHAKHSVTKLSDERVLDGLAAAKPHGWTYKDGQGDGGRHIGPMAEDMHKQFGDTVAPGGKVIDRTSQIGLQHAAINALHKRVKKLEHRKAA